MTSGHGHVTPLPDGAKARCGGPALCAACAAEQVSVAVNDPLIAALIECHRPVRKRDHLAYGRQYLLQCPACDGSTWKRWREGDPEVTCELWRAAHTRYAHSDWFPRDTV
jgi:hypothetical protein